MKNYSEAVRRSRFGPALAGAWKSQRDFCKCALSVFVCGLSHLLVFILAVVIEKCNIKMQISVSDFWCILGLKGKLAIFRL